MGAFLLAAGGLGPWLGAEGRAGGVSPGSLPDGWEGRRRCECARRRQTAVRVRQVEARGVHACVAGRAGGCRAGPRERGMRGLGQGGEPRDRPRRDGVCSRRVGAVTGRQSPGERDDVWGLGGDSAGRGRESDRHTRSSPVRARARDGPSFVPLRSGHSPPLLCPIFHHGSHRRPHLGGRRERGPPPLPRWVPSCHRVATRLTLPSTRHCRPGHPRSARALRGLQPKLHLSIIRRRRENIWLPRPPHRRVLTRHSRLLVSSLTRHAAQMCLRLASPVSGRSIHRQASRQIRS